MVVHKPYKNDPAYPLKEWDVITKIGDTPVDDQGMIKLGDDLRVRFQYQIQHIATNGAVPLTIVRAGKELKINLPVSADYPRLIPGLNGAYPSYFIYGPLVFSAATEDYLGGFLQTKYGADHHGAFERNRAIRWSRACRTSPRFRAKVWWSSPRPFSRTSWPKATAIRGRKW